MRYFIIILMTVLNIHVCTAGGLSYTETTHHSPKIEKYKIKKEKKERRPLSKREKIIIFGSSMIILLAMTLYFGIFYISQLLVSIYFIGTLFYGFCIISLVVKLCNPNDNFANWYLIAAGIFWLWFIVLIAIDVGALLDDVLYFSSLFTLPSLPAIIFSITIKNKKSNKKSNPQQP